MRDYEPPETGTLVIAALLLLALAFAAHWIITYSHAGGAPEMPTRWYLGAAVVVIVVGLVAGMRGGGGKDSE